MQQNELTPEKDAYDSANGFVDPNAESKANEELTPYAPEIFGQVDTLTNELTNIKEQNEHLRELLHKSNGVLRSCFSIIQRKGETTNWDAIEANVKDLLSQQHKIMYPHRQKLK